jgi:hypothetical protein
MVDQSGILTNAWQKWFQQIYTALGQAAGVVASVSTSSVITLFNTFANLSQTVVYTVPTGKSLVISAFTVRNTGSFAANISIWLVPAGGSASTANLLISAKSVAAGASISLPTLVNQILYGGGMIIVSASAGGTLVISASGRVSS